MAKVTGIGGVFIKTGDKPAMRTWLDENLGIKTEDWGCSFPWRDREDATKKGYTVLGLHRSESDYFDPSPHAIMINFRVDDLDGVLDHLRSRGITVLKVFDPEPNGRFAHVMGPEGVKIELWQPIENDPYDA
jgi:predicted enzyme related to lactoylglutathione lyase